MKRVEGSLEAYFRVASDEMKKLQIFSILGSSGLNNHDLKVVEGSSSDLGLNWKSATVSNASYYVCTSQYCIPPGEFEQPIFTRNGPS